MRCYALRLPLVLCLHFASPTALWGICCQLLLLLSVCVCVCVAAGMDGWGGILLFHVVQTLSLCVLLATFSPTPTLPPGSVGGRDISVGVVFESLFALPFLPFRRPRRDGRQPASVVNSKGEIMSSLPSHEPLRDSSQSFHIRGIKRNDRRRPQGNEE